MDKEFQWTNALYRKISKEYVPLSLLLSRELGVAAKLIWIVLRQDAPMAPERLFSPTRLSRRTGLTRNTVRNSLARLAASRWGAIVRNPHDRTIYSQYLSKKACMPMKLVTDRTIDVGARVLFGVLQGSPEFRHNKGSFTYASLGRLAQRDPRTVAEDTKQLVAAGWLELTQVNERAKIYFTLRNPHLIESKKMLRHVRRRVKRAPFLGEALMREYLSLIIDSDEFEDNAAPGFLVNPLTDERLQFDRFYPPNMAFEFNGPQHYGATERFSAEDAAQQRARDLMKTGICALREITLIVVHPEDLSLKTMQRKVVHLPLRDLEGYEPVANYLDSISRSYRRASLRHRN